MSVIEWLVDGTSITAIKCCPLIFEFPARSNFQIFNNFLSWFLSFVYFYKCVLLFVIPRYYFCNPELLEPVGFFTSKPVAGASGKTYSWYAQVQSFSLQTWRCWPLPWAKAYTKDFAPCLMVQEQAVVPQGAQELFYSRLLVWQGFWNKAMLFMSTQHL